MRAEPESYKKCWSILKSFESENVQVLLDALIQGFKSDKETWAPIVTRGYITSEGVRSFRFRYVGGQIDILASEQLRLVDALAECGSGEGETSEVWSAQRLEKQRAEEFKRLAKIWHTTILCVDRKARMTENRNVALEITRVAELIDLSIEILTSLKS